MHVFPPRRLAFRTHFAMRRVFSTSAGRGPAAGLNLVFLGAPGVGKGTFANKIAPLLNIPAISTGDIIRGEIKAGSALGKQCQEFTNSGKLVPDEVVSAMVAKRLQEPDAQRGWILVRFFFLHVCCQIGEAPRSSSVFLTAYASHPATLCRMATRVP